MKKYHHVLSTLHKILIIKPTYVFYESNILSEDELDVLIQVESLKRFDKIEKHLLFFKVTIIVCLILSVLYILWSLTFLVN